MATVVSDERTEALLASYHDLIEPFISQSPDLDFLPSNHATDKVAAWETEYARIGTQLGRNYADYYANRDVPMPIFQADPVISSNQATFAWDPSFSLSGDPL